MSSLVRLKKEMKFKTGEILPTGTVGTIEFPIPENSKNGTKFFFHAGPIIGQAKTYEIDAFQLVSYFGYRMPSEITLWRWLSDCTCKSVTGKTVEPDGYGDDNSPSWLLALGLI